MENHAFFDRCGKGQDCGIPKTPYRPVLPYDYNTDYQYQQRLLQGHPILLPVLTGPDKQEMNDMEYWKSMYPASMKRLQVLVEEGCDEVDYYGSPIYDEYPDQVTVRRLCARIAEKAAADERIQKDWGEELAGASCRENPRLCDLVDLLAMNELYRRRCKNRCQRRRFY